MNWKNWKPRPGMAAWSDSWSERWRRTAIGWVSESDHTEHVDGEAPCESLDDAVTDGPDLTDDVTVMSLLADLPWHELTSAGTPTRWWCLPPGRYTEAQLGGGHPTRKAAIIAAWQAVHGGEQ